MTNGSTTKGMGDFFGWSWPWPFNLAPNALDQSILPGWSLISITENNSSAPDTERRILAQDSYGRQIGRIMDALEALIEERPKGAPEKDAFTDFEALRKRVDKAKRQAATDRLGRIGDDLALLKTEDPKAYAAQVKALRALLVE